MRKKLIAGITVVSAATVFQFVAPTDAFGCHKGNPHGQQSEIQVTLEPVQEEPIVNICR